MKMFITDKIMSKPVPPVSAANAVPPAPPAQAAGNAMRLPSSATMEHAMKLAINEDRPIMLDYWKDSIEKTVLIGQRDDETKEKILVRSEEEYTSPIKQILKVGTDYIIMTENSIYLVDTGIPFRRISA